MHTAQGITLYYIRLEQVAMNMNVYFQFSFIVKFD
jgi:hypothetical protein